MTTGAERPPYGARQRKFCPLSAHFSIRPLSSETPFRCGPRDSGQSPSETLRGPCAEMNTPSARTIDAGRMRRLSIGYTRLRHLTARCFGFRLKAEAPEPRARFRLKAE